LLSHRLVLAAFVFRHFFDGLALAGALAEWSLACWLLGFVPSPVWHVVVPLTLAIVNRRAAYRLEVERPTGRQATSTLDDLDQLRWRNAAVPRRQP